MQLELNDQDELRQHFPPPARALNSNLHAQFERERDTETFQTYTTSDITNGLPPLSQTMNARPPRSSIENLRSSQASLPPGGISGSHTGEGKPSFLAMTTRSKTKEHPHYTRSQQSENGNQVRDTDFVDDESGSYGNDNSICFDPNATQLTDSSTSAHFSSDESKVVGIPMTQMRRPGVSSSSEDSDDMPKKKERPVKKSMFGHMRMRQGATRQRNPKR